MEKGFIPLMWQRTR